MNQSILVYKKSKKVLKNGPQQNLEYTNVHKVHFIYLWSIENDGWSSSEIIQVEVRLKTINYFFLCVGISMRIHFLEIKQSSVVCRQSTNILNYTHADERLIKMRARDFPKLQFE
jgi:hypothetical protein